MTILSKGRKIRSIIAKFIIVSLLSGIAFSLGIGTIVFLYDSIGQKADSAKNLSAGFGREQGITDFNIETGDPINGLQSTTAIFSIEESPSVSISKAIIYISDNFSRFTTNEISNVIISAVSADTKKTYKLEFYGSSIDDYKNDSFREIVNATNRIYTDGVIKNVSIVSKPTLDGRRLNEFQVEMSDSTSDSILLKGKWDALHEAISESLTLDGSTYLLTLSNNTESNGSLVFNSLFYDNETLTASMNIDPIIWKTAESYLEQFAFAPINRVEFTRSLNPVDSTMEIIYVGSSADIDTNPIITSFKDKAISTPSVLFPNDYITSLRFGEQVDAFYTAYPQ